MKATTTHRRMMNFKKEGYQAEVEIEITAGTDERADWAVVEAKNLMRGYGWTQTSNEASLRKP